MDHLNNMVQAVLLLVVLGFITDVGCLAGDVTKLDSDWTSWTHCSRECGGGVTSRERVCSDTSGKGCSKLRGKVKETERCNLMSCEAYLNDLADQMTKIHDELDELEDVVDNSNSLTKSVGGSSNIQNKGVQNDPGWGRRRNGRRRRWWGK